MSEHTQKSLQNSFCKLF